MRIRRMAGWIPTLAVTGCLLAAPFAAGAGEPDFSNIVTVIDDDSPAGNRQQAEQETGYSGQTGILSEYYGPEAAPGEEEQGMLTKPSENTDGVFGNSEEPSEEMITWNESWPYANYSVIHTGQAMLYRPACGNGYVICVNAGHGTAGGESAQTQCHPDGTPKVTGGSTAEGAIYATAVASGMTMMDGTPEAEVNLQLAMILKQKLLDSGFSVLMIRESGDVQFDNIARTVIANQYADCHLAIHYDSTQSDKGFFYMSVPDVASYLSMEPVASHWQEHQALGQALVYGVSQTGYPIFGDGSMPMDLTQTSYSTVPSLDVECGDSASDWSYSRQEVIADGILLGVKRYFGLE